MSLPDGRVLVLYFLTMIVVSLILFWRRASFLFHMLISVASDQLIRRSHFMYWVRWINFLLLMRILALFILADRMEHMGFSEFLPWSMSCIFHISHNPRTVSTEKSKLELQCTTPYMIGQVIVSTRCAAWEILNYCFKKGERLTCLMRLVNMVRVVFVFSSKAVELSNRLSLSFRVLQAFPRSRHPANCTQYR